MKLGKFEFKLPKMRKGRNSQVGEKNLSSLEISDETGNNFFEEELDEETNFEKENTFINDSEEINYKSDIDIENNVESDIEKDIDDNNRDEKDLNHQKKKMEKVKFSLAFKLFMVMLAISLVPLLILGGLCIKLLSDTSKSLVLNNLTQNIQNAQSIFQKDFNIYSSSANLLAENSDVLNFYKNEDEQGQQNIKRLLENVKQKEPNLDDIWIAFDDGRQILASGASSNGANPKEQEWYRGSMEFPEKLYYTQPRQSIKGDGPVTVISKAIMDGEKPIGVAAVSIKLDTFQKNYKNFKVGTIGYMEVISANAIVVSSKNEKRAGTQLEDTDVIYSHMATQKKGYGARFGYFDLKIGKGKYTAYYITDPDKNWKYVGIINENEFTGKIINIARTIMIILLLATIAVAIAAFFISKKVKDAFIQFEEVFARIAEGDFSLRPKLKTRDELGLISKKIDIAFNSLEETFSRTVDTSRELNSSAQYFSASSHSSSDMISQMSDALDEFADANQLQAEDMGSGINELEMLSANLNKIQDSIDEMQEKAEILLEVNNAGGIAMEELSEKSKLVEESYEKIEKSRKNMDFSTGQIGAIIKTIKDISDQTKMLSLNASIEAARAGKAGAGFGVVATEIGNLARQTQDATKEIENLVKSVSNSSNVLSNDIAIAQNATMEQNVSISQIKEKFTLMNNSSEVLTEKSENIKTDMQDIATLKDRVYHKLESIAATIEQSSATIEQISASAQNLDETFKSIAYGAEKMNDLSAEVERKLTEYKFKNK